jgi:TolB-like protein/DNA-binding winged helix-turn-helix (wHTH) protein
MPQHKASPKNLKFGTFEVDLQAGELSRLGKRIRLQEQPFELLATLLEKPGVLVTRDELHLKLWPETTVDFDHGLNKAISKIREALGDSAENPRFIETVARRGYRFLADVTVVGHEKTAAETGDLTRQPNFELPGLHDKVRSSGRSVRFFAPWFFGCLLVLAVSLAIVHRTSRPPSPEIHSIAVLPLQNLSRDGSQDDFASGIAYELITDLAQIRQLRVITCPALISHQTLREIGHDLNVEAVLTGSVSFSSNRVRIIALLVEMPSAREVWAQSYEGDLQDTLKTQSAIAHSIVEQLRMIVDRQQRGGVSASQ